MFKVTNLSSTKLFSTRTEKYGLVYSISVSRNVIPNDNQEYVSAYLHNEHNNKDE